MSSSRRIYENVIDKSKSSSIGRGKLINSNNKFT